MLKGCLVYGASFFLKLNPRGGFVILISGSFISASWALLVEYTGIVLLAVEMLETAFLRSAAPPSIWVATAVGFGILLSRLSHSLSCLSVLGKRMIISQMCRVKSHAYKQNHFTEYDPMADCGSPPALPSLPLPNVKKRKTKRKNCTSLVLQYMYSVSAALSVIPSYRLFFRTAQTRDNYSFGTMMS